MFEVRGYELQKRLDRHGSQGFVFKARQVDLDRPVALKIVPDRMGASASERVLREAQAIARMRSDHVVVVHAYGRGDGFVFMAMEFLEGEDFETAVSRRIERGRLAGIAEVSSPTMRIEPGAGLEATLRVDPDAIECAQGTHEETGELAPAALQEKAWLERVLDITSQVVSGLVALHAAGVVHSDVKPANIMLNGDRAKLIDFGTSRHGWVVDDHGRVIEGTPGFMAPEQSVAGSEPDARTDLFGLGATLYFALTGRPPFRGASLAAVISSVRHREPPDVRALNPAVEEPLAAIVRRLLRKRPEDRFASAAELQAEIDRLRAAERAPNRALGARRLGIVLGSLIAVLSVVVVFLVLAANRDEAIRLRIESLYTRARTDLSGAILEAQSLGDGERERLVDATPETFADGAERAMVCAALRAGKSVLGIDDRADCLWFVAPVRPNRELGDTAPTSLTLFDRVDRVRYRILNQGEVYAVYVHQGPDHAADWQDGSPFVLRLLVRITACDAAKMPVNRKDPPFPLVRIPPLCLTGASAGSAHLIDPFKPQGGASPFRAATVDRRKLITAAPLTRNVWSMYLLFARSTGEDDPSMLRLFAHPDEPDDFAKTLLDRPGSLTQEKQPARVPFWLAFRMCSYLGCQPPTLEEWKSARDANPGWFDPQPETWLNRFSGSPIDGSPFMMAHGSGRTEIVSNGNNHPVYGVRAVVNR